MTLLTVLSSLRTNNLKGLGATPTAERRLADVRRAGSGHVFAPCWSMPRSLINEDEPVPIELALALTPGFPLRQDIRAILLCGMGGLFLRVMLWRSKKRRTVP